MRSILPLVFAVACAKPDSESAAPTPSDTDTDTDADTDTDSDTDTDTDADTEPVVTSYAWSAEWVGDVVARAWMDRTVATDGTERLVGVSELDFRPFGYELLWRITEDVTLDPDGVPVTWRQDHQHTEWATTFAYTYVYDAATRSVSTTHFDHGGQWVVPGDGPVLMVPYPTDALFAGPATSPVAGTVLHRLLSHGVDIDLFLPYYGIAAEIAAEPAPSCGYLSGDQYCWDEDGVVDSYTPAYLGLVVVPGERPELDAFAGPPATVVVDTPDCALPEEGARHRTFVVVSADGTEIAGRLVLPEGAGPFPTVTLNSGTAGTDRTGAYNGLGVWDCVAAHLTAQGIAVASYDDRGWGASGGEISDSFVGRDEDAAAVAAHVAAEPEVGWLAMLGHSEGVAHACGAQPLVPEVDGLILASGIAGTGGDVLPEQSGAWFTAVGADPATVASYVGQSEELVADILAGDYDGMLVSGYPVDTFWKDLLEMNGVERALATAGPVLVVQGGMDWQVPQHHGEELHAALVGAGRDAELMLDPTLGHLLQPAVGGAMLGTEYGLPWAFDPALLDAIAGWIHDHAG